MMENSNKINYKIGFYIILVMLVCCVTIINYLYHEKQQPDTLLSYHKESILNSMSYSQKYIGTSFPVETIYNIISNDSIRTNFSLNTIVILLSNSGCHPCQLREVKFLQRLYEKLDERFDVLAIYLEANEMEAIKLKKVTKAKFDFFRTNNIRKFESLQIGYFPFIFLINKQYITYCYLPIPDNEEYSKWTLGHIEKLLMSFPN